MLLGLHSFREHSQLFQQGSRAKILYLFGRFVLWWLLVFIRTTRILRSRRTSILSLFLCRLDAALPALPLQLICYWLSLGSYTIPPAHMLILPSGSDTSWTFYKRLCMVVGVVSPRVNFGCDNNSGQFADMFQGVLLKGRMCFSFGGAARKTKQCCRKQVRPTRLHWQ